MGRVQLFNSDTTWNTDATGQVFRVSVEEWKNEALLDLISRMKTISTL